MAEAGDEEISGLQLKTKTYHNPETSLETEELRAFLHRQITTLPDSQRVMLMLRYQQNLSYAEIAEVVDVPLGTVKTGIFRARESLREAIRQFEEQPLWI
jgi:RNA polymerase sigma factor (sigma-70 family)